MNASVVTADITETDQLVEDWKKPVSPDVIKELSTLQTWKSIVGVLTEWVIIGSVITASWYLWSVHIAAGIAGYFAAIVLIGSRQHALAIIMHEGAHYRISNNRFWNELIGQLGAAWPLTIDMRYYRELHFSHHRAPNTDDDPDWELRETGDWSFPKTRAGIFFLFLGCARLAISRPDSILRSIYLSAQASSQRLGFRKNRLLPCLLYRYVFVIRCDLLENLSDVLVCSDTDLAQSGLAIPHDCRTLCLGIRPHLSRHSHHLPQLVGKNSVCPQKHQLPPRTSPVPERPVLQSATLASRITSERRVSQQRPSHKNIYGCRP